MPECREQSKAGASQQVMLTGGPGAVGSSQSILTAQYLSESPSLPLCFRKRGMFVCLGINHLPGCNQSSGCGGCTGIVLPHCKAEAGLCLGAKCPGQH